MLPFGGPGPNAHRGIVSILLLGALLLSSAGIFSVAAAPSSGVAGASHAPSIPVGAVLPAPRPDARPAAGTINSTFYASDSAVAVTPSNQTICQSSFFVICFPQAQSPNVLRLANGHIGVAFSVVTNFTTSPCAGAKNNVTVRIGFADSSNNGSTFGAMRYIGNNGSGSCPYFDGLEPSFTTGLGGHIFGAFVETNASNSSVRGAIFPFDQPVIPYITRPDDALAFITSSNNGTTFSDGTALVKANVSRPSIAAFGRTIYILYENISNQSVPFTTLPGLYGPGAAPISLNLLYSSNAGSTWNGPYVLPGLNATQYNTTLGPSIAVNRTGTVAVAYATNRTCVAWCGGFNAKWGYQIVDILSTTNGTKWSRPHVIASNVGETLQPLAVGLPGLFEGVPTTSIQFGSSPGQLYVAWAGTYNLSVHDSYPYQTDWSRPTTFAAASTDNGVTWSVPTMVPPPLRPYGDFSQQFGEANYNPALGVSGGRVYLTYTYESWTNNACGWSTFGSNYFCQAFAQYLATSPDGVAWSGAGILYDGSQGGGYSFYHYSAYTASIGFAAGGQPVVAYALPTGFYQYVPPIANQRVTLSVSTPNTGPTVPVTVAENGLASGTRWSAEIDGVTFSSTSSSFTIGNVPSGVPSFVMWNDVPKSTGYERLVEPLLSEGPTVTFSAATTVYYNFTTFFGLNLSVQPPNVPNLQLSFHNYGSVDSYAFQYSWSTSYSSFGGSYYYASGIPFPWYFPSGTAFSIANGFFYPIGAGYFSPAVMDYWNGTGLGSFTGAALDGNITLSSPINETMWMGGVGSYSASFRSVNLPATSVFGLNLDGGARLASPATLPLTVGNLSTGAHWIANVTANSSKPGWEYFGTSSVGSPMILPEQPDVNLTFSAVNLSGAAGPISFRAAGLASGTPWRFLFNGTVYGSSTPWINVSARPGNYSVQGYPVVAANASAAYAPTGLGSTWSVKPNTQYTVNFNPVYRLQTIASTGGTISPSPATYWVNPGTTENFTASAAPGYSWNGWTGSGPGAYSGTNLSISVTPAGPVTEAASFVPLPSARFNLTLNESGLPAGALWTVYLGTTGFSSNTSAMVIPNLYSCAVSGARGTYPFLVPYVYPGGASSLVRYVPAAYPRTVCVTAPVSVQFTPQYFLSVATTGSGSAQATYAGAGGSGSGWVDNGTTVQLSESASTGSSFVDWVGTGPGSYSGTSPSPSFVPAGPVTETAVFAPTPPVPSPRYSITFTVAGATFAPGTSWSVRLGLQNFSSTGPTLVASGLLASIYPATFFPALAPDGRTQYVPNPAQRTIDVSANQSVAVTFGTNFWVVIGSNGHGSVSPTSGWDASGATLHLVATPDSGYSFVAWIGDGNGAYSGTSGQANVTVRNPLTESASFAPLASAVQPATSAWSSPGVWVGLGLAGLAVGVGVGVLLARGRMRRGSSDPNPPPSEETPR